MKNSHEKKEQANGSITKDLKEEVNFITGNLSKSRRTAASDLNQSKQTAESKKEKRKLTVAARVKVLLDILMSHKIVCRRRTSSTGWRRR